MTITESIHEPSIVPPGDSGDFSCAVGAFASSHQMVSLNMSGPSDTSTTPILNGSTAISNAVVTQRNVSPFEVFEWEMGKDIARKVISFISLFSFFCCHYNQNMRLFFGLLENRTLRPYQHFLNPSIAILSTKSNISRAAKFHLPSSARNSLLYQRIKSNNFFLIQVFLQILSFDFSHLEFTSFI
jgi:hypothetical protein